ncbi:MAG: transglutaminase domain-containing protein [Microthrixaceae bacterium]
MAVWLLVTVITLAYGTTLTDPFPVTTRDRRTVGMDPPPPHRRRRDRTRGRRGHVPIPLAAVAAATCLALALGPSCGASVRSDRLTGASLEPWANRDSSALTPTDSLSISSPPRLGDGLVMTVRTDEPGFWRTQTFDFWDGRRWMIGNSYLSPLDGDRLPRSEWDLALDPGIETVRFTDDFTLTAGSARSLPTGPRATSIRVPTNVGRMEDGSIVAYEPVGAGTTYRVTSVRPRLSADVLRGRDPRSAPARLLERFATRPTMSARTARLARSLGAATPDAAALIGNVERWMSTHTTYSIGSSVDPSDPVDDFLFGAKRGWCEQIATAMVVILRANGIPARLATGFVPTQRDPLTGTYQVRARDAHAWAEVWFPGAGWVPFDPTADVPLGDGSSAASVSGLANRALSLLPPLMGILTVALVAGQLVADRRSARHTRTPGRRRRRGDWLGRAERALEGLGSRAGRPRDPHEPWSRFGDDVAELLGDERPRRAGHAIDAARCSPDGLDDTGRTRVLDDLRAAASAHGRRPAPRSDPPEPSTPQESSQQRNPRSM